MVNPDIETLIKAIQTQWPIQAEPKNNTYIDQFHDRVRVGTRISAKVNGNHGVYTVSIRLGKQLEIKSACSCYIGKDGYCHHCAALAATFLRAPDSFIEKPSKKLEQIKGLDDISAYLESMTLESLIVRLKENGVSQKAFAASIGMSTQHLSAVKSSELRNHYFNELGAIKLACLWVLELHGKTKTTSTA